MHKLSIVGRIVEIVVKYNKKQIEIYHRKVFKIHKLKIVSNSGRNFTFMLPCIVIDLFSNNQPDPLIIPILFCYKTLHVSGIFSAHHQEFPTVHSALVSFMQVSDDSFQAESRWNCSSILTLFGNGHQKLAGNLPVPNVQ